VQPKEFDVKATVTISTATGSEILTASVDDYDPFVILAVRDVTIQLIRDECRTVSEALRAAALWKPYETALDLLA
jgi:hypothetical protein